MNEFASGQWTLGIKIGLPFAIFGFLLFSGWAVYCTRYWLTFDPYKYHLLDHKWAAGMWAGISWLGVVLYVMSMLFVYWPLDAAYHQYRPVSGTVDSISSRIVSSGDGGSDQNFVVTLTSGPQQYTIGDSRAALLKHGDHVSLFCVRQYDYGSNNAGYGCKWGK